MITVIQLNRNTQVRVSNDYAREKWLSQYPGARIIGQEKAVADRASETVKLVAGLAAGKKLTLTFVSDKLQSFRTSIYQLAEKTGRKFSVRKIRQTKDKVIVTRES